jgi:hypothetical protein
MDTLPFIIGWYIVGFLMVSVSTYIARKSYTLGDLILCLIFGLFGPINLAFVIFWIFEEYGDKKLF